MESSPCNVVVLKDCGNRKFKRVLVPVAGGPNGALALEVANILAEKDEGEIVVLTVKRDGATFDIGGFVEEQRVRLEIPPGRLRTKVVESRSSVYAILKEADDYDLVVLGSTLTPLMYRVVRHSVPEMVARMSAKPVVVVRASGGIRSWIRRWI